MPAERLSCAPLRAGHLRGVTAAALLLVAALAPTLPGASSTVEWCYQDSSCNDTVWATTPFGYCNGTRQSPVNIVTANVQPNASLTGFTFSGFSNHSIMSKISNNGHTVQMDLQAGSISVVGGGLPATYKALQFHLHWGNGSKAPGSEHTVDSKRYPMELHLVTIKTIYNNLSEALNDPEGLAAFGFFIEGENTTNLPASWAMLTSYLPNISYEGNTVNFSSSGLSMDDLLPGVNRTRYYRYLGSLTTPLCNEVVTWTVFQDPVNVSNNLIDLFSSSLYFTNVHNVTEKITDVYRNVQKLNNRVITTPGNPNKSASSRSVATPALLCFVLLVFLLLLQ
ncbi:carbonic anhydrase 4-like [Arapaima gigas]